MRKLASIIAIGALVWAVSAVKAKPAAAQGDMDTLKGAVEQGGQGTAKEGVEGAAKKAGVDVKGQGDAEDVKGQGDTGDDGDEGVQPGGDTGTGTEDEGTANPDNAGAPEDGE